MTNDGSIFVGIDWGNYEHRACALDAAGAVLGERTFAHDRDGLHELAEWLLGQQADPSRILVAVERAEGPLVETLLERCVQVFCVNPLQTDRLRDQHSPAGAKDDRRDALVLADALMKDHAAGKRFRAVNATSPAHLMLRELSRMESEIKVEINRVENRLREQLQRYYLQALNITDRLSEAWYLALILRVHSPEIARQDIGRFVTSLLRRHHIRRLTSQQVLATLREPSVSVAPGTAAAASLHVRQLARQLQLLNEQLREVQRDLETALARYDAQELEPGQKVEQRDAAILLSLPGFGRTTVATLLAEAPEAIQRRDYQRLRKQAGIAPVTKKSGRSRRVEMRRACNGRLRQAMTIAAGVAIQHDAKLRALYDRHRPQVGPRASYGRALRAVADNLIRMAMACLRDQSSYDQGRRIA